MGWSINCTDTRCARQTWACNIVDLITNYRDAQGWFLCSCGKHGYVEKSFKLQEAGEVWEPYLRGIILLGKSGDTYQPFVFLVSYESAGKITDVWFSYYKDLRRLGGRLKLGYGPGGPPVLSKRNFLDLVSELIEINCLTGEEIKNAIERPYPNKALH